MATITPTNASAARLGVGRAYLEAKNPKKKAATTVRKMLKTTINVLEVDLAAFENSEAQSEFVDRVEAETFVTCGARVKWKGTCDSDLIYISQ